MKEQQTLPDSRQLCGLVRVMRFLRFDRNFLQLDLALVGSTLFVSLATAGGNLISARLLDPFSYGCVQTAFLLASYLWVLSLGVLQGVTQQYPMLLGRGQAGEAEKTVVSAHAFIRLVALAGIVAGTFQWYFFMCRGVPGIMQVAAFVNIFCIGADILSGVHQAALVGRQNFRHLVCARACTGVVTLAMLVVVWRYGAVGQSLRFAAMAMVGWLMLRWASHDIVHGAHDWSTVRALGKTGLPILLASGLIGVSNVIDRTLMAVMLGPQAVGLYSIAGFVMLLLNGIMMPLISIYYTQANVAYGQTGDPKNLWPILVKYHRTLLAVALPLIALLYALMPALVTTLLPAYASGIEAGRIACLAGMAQCAMSSYFIFFTLNRSLVLSVLLVVPMAALVLVVWFLPRASLTVESIAWCRMGMVVIMAVLINGVLFLRFKRQGARAGQGIRRDSREEL